MSSSLKVSVNGKVVLEYDKQQRLPGQQRRFLDKMDSDMDSGIELAGNWIESPGQFQRGRYVAMTLTKGMYAGNKDMVAMACAYLSKRIPEVVGIEIEDSNDEVNLELIC